MGVRRNACRFVHVDDLGRRRASGDVERCARAAARRRSRSRTLVAEPEAISPNGDGQADATTLTYRLPASANVTIEVTDAIGGVVATVVDRVWTTAGQHTVELDGAALADGTYNVVVTARNGGWGLGPEGHPARA